MTQKRHQKPRKEDKLPQLPRIWPSLPEVLREYFEGQASEAVFTASEAVAWAAARLRPGAAAPRAIVEWRLKQAMPLFFLPDPNGGELRYCFRWPRFAGAKLRIVPTAFELAQGILYAGGRLAPYCAEDLAPEEYLLHLTQDTCAEPIAAEPPPAEADIGLALLGEPAAPDDPADEMPETGGGDAPDATGFPEEEAKNAELATEDEDRDGGEFGDDEDFDEEWDGLPAFNLAEFYAQHQFRLGDALELTVACYDDGEFILSGVSHSGTPDFAGIRAWCQTMEQGLERCFVELGPWAPIPRQLAQALFLGGDRLLREPLLDLPGFLKISQKVAVKPGPNGPVLWRRHQDPLDPACTALGELPHHTDIRTSLGDITNDLLLSPVNESMFVAFMRDDLYHGRNQPDALLERMLGPLPASFASPGQQQDFTQLLHDLWTVTGATYRRGEDQHVAELRATALGPLTRCLRWWRYALAGKVDLSVLPHGFLYSVTGQVDALAMVVGALNDPRNLPPEQQALAETTLKALFLGLEPMYAAMEQSVRP